MASLAQPRYTPEQYLERERAAEYKSEYINGQIYAMAGASRQHSLITVNVGRELSSQLCGRPFETYVNDMRVRVRPTGMYTYPDVTVACGEPQFEDMSVDTLLNPTVVVEVLSPSSEAYDRGEKFAHYRRLPSLREYVLIAQDKVRVEHFARRGDQWVLTEFSDPDGTLPLAAVDCVLALRDIYDRVEFPSDRPEESESGASGA